MNLINRQKSEHYYLPDGQPFYEVENKSKPGTFRPTTIADARKAGAYPSMTTILQLLAQPGLESWKREQILMSALTSEKKPEETLEDFAHRIIDDSEQQSKDAAGLGTEVHLLCEEYITRSEPSPYPLLEAKPEIKKGIQDWLHKQEFDGFCEKIMVHSKLGLAGKIDYVGYFNGVKTILDFKTQSTKKDKKYTAYDNWCYQLAGYELMHDGKFTDHVNVVISTTEPGRIEIHKWESSDIENGALVVKTLRELFRLTRGL